MAGLVLLSVFVCKAPFGVPSQESSIVVGNFLERGVTQLGPLLVVPDRFIRIIRIRHGFVSLVHPLRDGAEVEND